jgi:hypothetical protein
MKRLLIIFIAFVFFMGCSSARYRYTIHERVDPVTNEKFFTTAGNYLEPAHSFLLALDMQINDKDTPKQTIFLVLGYAWSGWAFIQAGESLIFNVDGEVIKFYSQDGSANSRQVNRGIGDYPVSEGAMYKFDRKNIEKIINGKKVIGKVVGQKLDLHFTVTPENQNNFKKMLLEIK